MKRFLESLREGDNLLQTGAIAAAVFFLLASPCWTLYSWLLDLGPGGWGGTAQADTPAASSIADMERLERFTLYVRGDSEGSRTSPAIFVDDAAYWIIELDSGEQVAVRPALESIQYTRRDGTYLTIYPVGSWREWKLSGESRDGAKRDAPQLTTTEYFVDMEGHHREGRTRENFTRGFHTLSLVVGLAALLAAGLFQDRKKERKAAASLPRNDLERWIAGTYAIWGQFFAQLGHTPDGSRDVKARRGPIRFGGQPMDEKGRDYTRKVLENDWEIENKKDLFETVEYMSAGPGFERCDSQSSRAWQLCRSMQLLGMGFVAGWYGREELLRRSCQVGRTMQAHFRSWDELCQGFLEGFFTWRSRAYGAEDARAALQERREIYEELQRRPDSPYRLNWYLPLNPERGRKAPWEK